MKGRLIALDEIDGRKASALVEDGRLTDLLVDPPAGAPPRPGTIFRAMAERPMKGMGGLMVGLPEGARGFLREGKGVRPGQPVLVQVSGFAEPGKAVPVSAKILFKGQFAIVTPGAPGVNISRQIKDPLQRQRLLEIAQGAGPDDLGLIVRSASVFADDADIAADIARQIGEALRILAAAEGSGAECLAPGPDAHAIARRDWEGADRIEDGAGVFLTHGIDEMIAAMASAHVPLPGGGSAWIEPTRALVAVDVNTGADTSAAAGLKVNIELARDLPRQLRCRGLGGQITIDMAPFPKAARKQVENTLRTAFRADSTETALVGWTPLGHFELQRKRDRFAHTGLRLAQ